MDNWRRSRDPERSLLTPWTGCTECERATDGEWIPFPHESPRMTLFVPTERGVWTGRRRTTLRYVEEFPLSEESVEESSSPLAAEAGVSKASGKKGVPTAPRVPGKGVKAAVAKPVPGRRSARPSSSCSAAPEEGPASGAGAEAESARDAGTEQGSWAKRLRAWVKRCAPWAKESSVRVSCGSSSWVRLRWGKALTRVRGHGKRSSRQT